MILCVGDSLTLGCLGYSYIHFMKTDECLINKGVNGDTTWGVLERLRKYLREPWCQQVGTVIIAAGTNDILLPYMCSLSGIWKLVKGPKAARGQCCASHDQFREVYTQLIELALPRKVILVGLPLIHLDRFPIEDVMQRNAIIRELAGKYGLSFVDIYALQKAALTHEPSSCSWGVTSLKLLCDSLVMWAFPQAKDWLAKTRKFELTVDGVHFNAASARLVAAALEGILNSKGSDPNHEVQV
ncbi:MAG: SGNH/GDSL hydrolase family protein [Limnochordia bacterium]